ncbi:MAG: transporter, partial [Rhodospirillales bacterium]|nr:transporter [Rhodospirillales bacterium]
GISRQAVKRGSPALRNLSGSSTVGWCAVLQFPLLLSLGMVQPARAQSEVDNLMALQKSISVQQEKLQQEEEELARHVLQLQRQQQLLNSEMAKLRGAGTAAPAPQQQAAQQVVQVAQPAPPAEAPAGGATIGAEQQQAQAQNQQDQTKVILQSATVLTNTGGVLTPKGQLVIDPSVEYDYWTQNQLNLNGFTIIPGITFGNIFVSRVDQRYLMPALTLRYGITDRLELNLKVPFVLGWGSTTAQQAGPSAVPLTASAHAASIGDVQFGASYQFNSGDSGWPIFVGNLTFKTATGQNPYEVPIYDATNTGNQLLFGIPKKLPTGTGFYSLQPSLTVFYPTAPGVLFGNFQYIKNFSHTYTVPSTGGGPGTPVNLSPGQALAVTFGIGFALNDKASMTFSYQEEHVFPASADGRQLPGSAYDFGTFNFGLGYAISKRTSLNVGVGIGVGPYAPAAKILVEVPVRMNLF